MLVKLNYLHACSLSLAWVGYGIEGLVVGMKQLNRLVKHDLVRVLNDVVFKKDKLCSSYQGGK